MKKLLLILLIVVLVIMPISAREYTGFITGKMFLEFEENEKLCYVMGMSDILDVSMQEADYDKYFEVTLHIKAVEYLEMFEKYLAENPKLLEEMAAFGFFEMVVIRLIMEMEAE